MGHLPSAIFCGSDVIAAILIQAAAERDIRIPNEVSVVGFCDEEFAKFLSPPLTTVRQDPFSIAAKGVDILLNIIEEKDGPEKRKEVVPVEFVERNSVKKLN